MTSDKRQATADCSTAALQHTAHSVRDDDGELTKEEVHPLPINQMHCCSTLLGNSISYYFLSFKMFEGPHRVILVNHTTGEVGCEYCGVVSPFVPGPCPNYFPIQPQVGKNTFCGCLLYSFTVVSMFFFCCFYSAVAVATAASTTSGIDGISGLYLAVVV